MFTNKDIEYRSIFVINCVEDRALRVQTGELLLEDTSNNKILTKLPFQKMIALFVIGHITVTTALVDKCSSNGVALVVMLPNLRPVFFHSISAEANFLIRKKQYEYSKDDLQVAKIIVRNKISNQRKLLENTRLKTDVMIGAINQCENTLGKISDTVDYTTLLGLEGIVAKDFFSAYYGDIGWKGRYPRTKVDVLNSVLDIGYTILFNYIEVFVRMFGFDPYIGVYHRLWFKRKSLICDLMEPFRCIIDTQVRKSFNMKQFKDCDFDLIKNEYFLKNERRSDYSKIFYTILIEYKSQVFEYVREYYRCFMQHKQSKYYPSFNI